MAVETLWNSIFSAEPTDASTLIVIISEVDIPGALAPGLTSRSIGDWRQVRCLPG